MEQADIHSFIISNPGTAYGQMLKAFRRDIDIQSSLDALIRDGLAFTFRKRFYATQELADAAQSEYRNSRHKR